MMFIDWNSYPLGNTRDHCPECCKGQRDKSLGITIGDDGSGIAHCFRCGLVITNKDRLKKASSALFKETCETLPSSPSQKRTILSPYWRAVWDRAQPINGTPAESYLRLRGCPLPPAQSHIRYVHELKHPDGWVGEAIIALITNALTCEPMSLHRTWILEGSSKVVDRRLINAHQKQGGVIRLWPDEDVTHGLAIAEGIETALSLSAGYTPVWSLIDASNLAAFPVLSGIECLLIGADHDEVGIDAAQKCANRWLEDGHDVALITPVKEKTDFNDLGRVE